LLDDFTRSMTLAFKAEGESILLVGTSDGWLGQSLYLREVCGREEGAPPPVDLAAGRRHAEFVRALIRDGLVTAVHDVSDGGILVALAEMAMVSRIGAVLEAPHGAIPHAFWYGEDQGRYLVTAKDHAEIERRAKAALVPVQTLGATGGRVIALGDERPVPLETLIERFESWLPSYMAGSQ
jgi:phosphoribosylformylglycinamidine synthase